MTPTNVDAIANAKSDGRRRCVRPAFGPDTSIPSIEREWSWHVARHLLCSCWSWYWWFVQMERYCSILSASFALASTIYDVVLAGVIGVS